MIIRPKDEERIILNKYADDLERIIKNNNFDELTNYYAYISISFKEMDLNNVYLLFLDCFMMCAEYNNIKAFKYLYTIFKQENISSYNNNVRCIDVSRILRCLITTKQYEMFRYLEHMLLDAISFKLDYFDNELIIVSIRYENYEMFEYALNHYDIGFKNTYWHLKYFHLDDTKKKRFYKILLNTVPFEFDNYETQQEITHDMIQCGAFEIGTFDEYIDNYLYGINTLINTYKHKKNYVMDKIFFKN